MPHAPPLDARRRLIFSHARRYPIEAEFLSYLADVKISTYASDELVAEATLAYRRSQRPGVRNPYEKNCFTVMQKGAKEAAQKETKKKYATAKRSAGCHRPLRNRC